MKAEAGQALVLGTSPFGEADVLVHLFCPQRGRLRGLVKGGAKKAAILQPLNTVEYERFRRLENQLGTLNVELTISRAPLWLGGGAGSYVCTYLSELLTTFLPEEQPFPQLSERVLDLAAHMGEHHTWHHVLAFELFFLDILGYGLRLTDPVHTAVPEGSADELAYVSPRSGRTVGRVAAQGYEHRLLPLPACLGGPACDTAQDRAYAFALTGAFLHKALPPHMGTTQPLLARARLAGYYARTDVNTTQEAHHAAQLLPIPPASQAA
jgi:DNA repair protein RecO (recombination protein O)